MRTCFCMLALFLCFSGNCIAQKEKSSIEASVIGFFDGLTEVDIEKLKTYSSTDFLLLEHGEVWTLDTLIKKISPKRTNRQRTNKFEFIKTEQRGAIAWVSYLNTAEIKYNERQQTIKWLESAVLIKEKGKWKIKMMHSTRMN